PRLNDMVRVHIELSRPSYSYLIALNPNGKVELCIPPASIAPSSPLLKLDFPEDPADYFGRTDGVALQAFVLVASGRPFAAYDTWQTQVHGSVTWSRVDSEGLWVYDSSAGSDELPPGVRLRGTILQREAAPQELVRLCDLLRRVPGVTLVSAVAFPVKP